jgi:phosphoglycerol transferase MdoB-like AlkP superfamily enzyme
MRQIFISHRKLAVLLVVDLVFFVIAELTYQNAKHPGTASNIAWYAFLIGAASLVVLVIVAIMPRSRRLTR